MGLGLRRGQRIRLTPSRVYSAPCDTVGVAVPVEMREGYTLADSSRVTGVATCGDFRRFEVRVEEQVAS